MSPGRRPRKNASAMRMLGKQLSAARHAAGYTQRTLSEHDEVPVDEETIASMEQGRRLLKPDLAEIFDRVLDCKGTLSAGVDNLPEVDQFPLFAEKFMEQEQEAITMSLYANQVFPGLLQSEPYARSVFRSRVPGYTPEKIESLTTARIERHKVLHGEEPPEVSYVIWEPVFHLALSGGRTQHREQLLHVRACMDLTNVTVQVLLLESTEHAGLNGPFVLMETPEHQHVAYTETQRGSLWVSDPNEVSILASKYAMLRSQALTPKQSRVWLDGLLGEA
ncbi:Scr1 family TA system antitoxin-like transcriptional regulator [Streptomyces sp. NPDC051561]|uniref:helix-turn-helix domain-containing protein n=1 Tax=Streptomyces sp. NPDC051561 TaxID=3365658 RepID=UPI00378F5BE8